jgi:hypothetical protein
VGGCRLSLRGDGDMQILVRPVPYVVSQHSLPPR